MKTKTTRLSIIMALLLAPYVRPSGLYAIIPGSQYVYDGLSLVSLCLLFVMYLGLKRGRDRRADFQLLLTVLFFAVLAYPTLRNGGDKMVLLRIAVSCIGIMFYVRVFAGHARKMFSIALLELEVLVYLNAVCIVLFPNGMYLSHGTFGSSSNWLMGYDNHWFIFYYAAYYLAVVCGRMSGNRVREYVLIAVLHLTTLYVMSGVLVIGMLLLDGIYFFRIYQKKWFTFRIIVFAGIFVTVALVFFSTNTSIQYLVNSIFHKTDSMFARGLIWTRAMNLIRTSPAVGIGRMFEMTSIERYGLTAAVNAHNMWIEIGVEGGILGLALFFLSVFLGRNRKGEKAGEAYRMALVPLLVIMIVMSVDSMLETRGVMAFFIFAVACNMPAMEKQLEGQPVVNLVVQAAG